jgi:cyclic pyranopterin phosphate synthase
MSVVPDEKILIQQQIREWVAEDIQFIFTTGGTGLGAARQYGQRGKGNAGAGCRRDCGGDAGLWADAHADGDDEPGGGGLDRRDADCHPARQQDGARESLEAILPAVFHARKMMMKGGGH